MNTQHTSEDCQHVRDEFSALLDGELSPDELDIVEQHLSTCSECLRKLDAMKRVDQTFGSLDAVAAPPGFEEGVQSALRPRARIRRRSVVLGPILAVAAMLMVVVVLGSNEVGAPTSTMDLAKVQSEASGSDSIDALSESDLGEMNLADRAYDKSDSGLVELKEEVSFTESAEAVIVRDAPQAAEPASPMDRPGEAVSSPRPLAAPEQTEKRVARRLEESSALASNEFEEESSAVGGFDDALEGLSGGKTSGAGRAVPPGASTPEVKDAMNVREQIARADRGAGSRVEFADEDSSLLEADSFDSEARTQESFATSGLDDGRYRQTAADPQALPKPKVAFEAETVPDEEADSIAALGYLDATSTDRNADNKPDSQKIARTPAPERESIQNFERAKKTTSFRSFLVKEGVWIQQGYAGEELIELDREANAFAEMYAQDPELKAYLDYEARIIFEHQGEWYALPAMDATP